MENWVQKFYPYLGRCLVTKIDQIPSQAGSRLLEPEATVSMLIDMDNVSWKSDLVYQLFEEEEAQLIVSIPLPHVHHPDSLIWHYGNRGMFSVNSAYHLAVQYVRQQRPSTSNANNEVNEVSDATQWKFIWNNYVPPRVQMFVWRCCHEAVLTASNLARRVSTVETQCLMYGEAEESLLHVLLYCSYARQVWALTNLRWHVVMSAAQNSVHQWLRKVYFELGKGLGDRFLVVCWCLW
ncbi:UNVERIFIED_CONTAM: hypothetical protein Slati_3679100 [Sesamum latifolium]|uniref:Reverse transcriptase zinc-binding domain-containing protein n=1 Tax=Sesamum latifolium TaxID=2727402 RepID=A0AAW2U230_9LAMI